MTSDATPSAGVPAPAATGRSSRPEQMAENREPGRARAARIASQTGLTLVLLAFLSPFVWMFSAALKTGAEVFTSPPTLLGERLLFSNFVDAWTYVPFGRFMANGMIVATLGTLVVCATSVLAGYAFAWIDFRGRGGLFLVYLMTLMVPQEVVVVPMFILMQALGWVDSYAALVLPWAFTAFGTFLLRQFFLTVPRELEEAARVDGAGRLRTLLTVMVPIARPAVAVLSVFTFITYWNSFLWPLIVTNTIEMSTVPVGLNAFLGQQGSQWQLLMAAAAISMVPTVVMVLLLQRHLVRGIALSGLGGR